MKPIAIAITSFLALVASTSLSAQDPKYTFVRIVDSSDGFGFWASVSINNAGQVAFVGTESNPPLRYVLRGDGGPLTTIHSDNRLASLPLCIDDSGNVFFSGRSPSGPILNEIRSGDGTAPAVLLAFDHATDSTQSPYQRIDGVYGCNEVGQFVFRAALWSGGDGLFTGMNPATDTIMDTASDSFSSLWPNFSIGRKMSNSGGVVFRATPAIGTHGIYVSDGGPATRIAFPAGANGLPNHFSINDADVVGYTAAVPSVPFFETNVYSATGVEVTKLFDESDSALMSPISPDLRDDGTVVFAAQPGPSLQGLYVGPDPVEDKVIGPGDALDGSTVTGIGVPLGRYGNDAGQIVFRANLADGRSGIYRADPIEIPPTLVLAVNGDESDVVSTPSLVNLTLDLDPGTETDPLDWYYAILVSGQVFWVTSGGVSATPAPLLTSPPVPLDDVSILNGNLGPGSVVTFLFFLWNGSEVVSYDFITAVVTG